LWLFNENYCFSFYLFLYSKIRERKSTEGKVGIFDPAVKLKIEKRAVNDRNAS
jgi:hypothetical protein